MSDLSRAIARARRQVAREETPIRRSLAASYQRAIDELRADLDGVTRMIADARRSGVDVNPDWLRRQGRYRTLIAHAEQEFLRFADEGMRILREGRVRAVSGGAAEAWELAAAAGVGTTAAAGFGSRINTPALERLVAALGDGSPVRDVLDGYGRNASQVIEERLVQGVIQGTGPREVVRQIVREIGSPVNRARLETLTRTEYMRAYRGSLFQTYVDMGIKRWVWSAGLGPRCCLACVHRHGTVYSMKQTFMAVHPACRCIASPYSDAVPVERGDDWFARQSPVTQRAMMPSQQAFAAYQAGDVELKHFVGHRRSQVWGSSIVQMSGREALRRAS